MKILCSWIFVVVCVNATRLHYASPLLLTTLQQQQLQQLQQPPATATTEYHDEDTLAGFYSYGYNDDVSAKAEFKAVDGSSKGFYSYVDTNGKLQTVEYVAGRELGFQAAATNLPKAPVDNRRGPAPVKDTPEVQMAKKAHFEAYREAELRAALAGGDETATAMDDDEQSEGADQTQDPNQNQNRDKNGRQRDEDGQRLVNNVLRSNLREQQKLLLLMANGENGMQANSNDERLDNEIRSMEEDGSAQNNINDVTADDGRSAQMTTYRLQTMGAGAAARIPNYSRSSLIGLGLHDVSGNAGHVLSLLPAPIYTPAVYHSTLSASSVPLSVHSYQASLAPTATTTYRYHLPPTVIATVPRVLGSSITTNPERNLSGFLTHRLNIL